MKNTNKKLEKLNNNNLNVNGVVGKGSVNNFGGLSYEFVKNSDIRVLDGMGKFGLSV